MDEHPAASLNTSGGDPSWNVTHLLYEHRQLLQLSRKKGEEEAYFVDYIPPARDAVTLPRNVVYVLVGVVLVIVATYAIVGHLIKDLMHDLAGNPGRCCELSETSWVHVPSQSPLRPPCLCSLWALVSPWALRSILDPNYSHFPFWCLSFVHRGHCQGHLSLPKKCHHASMRHRKAPLGMFLILTFCIFPSQTGFLVPHQWRKTVRREERKQRNTEGAFPVSWQRKTGWRWRWNSCYLGTSLHPSLQCKAPSLHTL